MSTNDRTVSLVICGLGGQGILFLTRLLGEAAIGEGREVMTSETHGMAQRGGAVYSHMKFGPCESPQVRLGRADAAMALEAGRRPAAEAFLAPQGLLVVNAPGDGRDRACCDAAAAAAVLGAPRSLNLVLLGFALGRAPQCFPGRDAILAALERLSSSREFLDQNRRALGAGERLA